MSSLTRSFAPYAAPKNVLDFIRRKRERGLPDTISAEVLQQIGVPQGNVPRTLQALRFLTLIAEDGHRSGLLDRIGAATTEEYPKAIAEMVQSAYQPVFAVVDPALDRTEKIADAFRAYQPASQRSRMVALFLALCREAGLVGNRTRRSTATAGSKPNIRSVSSVAHGAAARSTATPLDSSRNTPSETGASSLDYRILSALVQQLPPSAKWSKRKRQKWLQAVASAVDLMVEVVDE